GTHRVVGHLACARRRSHNSRPLSLGLTRIGPPPDLPRGLARPGRASSRAFSCGALAHPGQGPRREQVISSTRPSPMNKVRARTCCTPTPGDACRSGGWRMKRISILAVILSLALQGLPAAGQDKLVVSIWGGSWRDLVADTAAKKFTQETGVA